jgi:hypothetical protein
MAFDFPSSPTDGQIFSPSGGPSYIYRLAGTKWEVYQSPPAGFASTTEVLTGTEAGKASSPDSVAALWELVVGGAPAAATFVVPEGGYCGVTGSTGITGFNWGTKGYGSRIWLLFVGAPLLTHSATFTLPGGVNYQCVGGEFGLFIRENATDTRCLVLNRNDGTPVIKASPTDVLTGTDANKTVTADALAALWERGPDVAAAAATVLGEGGYFWVTGNTGINGITFATPKAGRSAWVFFTGTPLLTQDANFLLPNLVSYQASTGDKLLIVHEGTTIYRVLEIQRFNGKPVVPNTALEISFSPAGNIAATTVQAAIAELDVEQGPGFKNLLMNPFGLINQRGATTPTDDTYAHDRWYALTQTAAIGVVTVYNGIDFAGPAIPSLMRLTQVQAAAQRIGYAQIIEGKNCRHLNAGGTGNPVIFSGNIQASSAFNLRYAILSWVSTEDALPSDIVQNWSSTNYAGGAGAGKFFYDSIGFVVEGTGVITAPASFGMGTFSLTVASPSVAANRNYILFIWSEAAMAQNAWFAFWAQFEAGLVATPPEIRPYPVELAMCQRYFEVSAVTCGPAVANITNQMDWKVSKRIGPALSYTFDNGAGATFGNKAALAVSGIYQIAAHGSLATATVSGNAEL